MKTSFKKLTSLFLAILMIMSVAITGVSAATVDENPTAEAQTVYVDVSAITGDYVYAAWKWTTGDGAWYTLTDNGTYLETTMEVGENIIIAAMNAGTASPDWNAKVYQTDNITDYNGTNNLLVCTSGGSQGIAYSWANYDGEAVNTTESTTLETLPSVVHPSKTPETESTAPTFPAEPDEDVNLYVVAQSNLNTTGVKVKTTGNLISVSYSLTADQIIDGGQAVITYDTDKMALVANNAGNAMFPVIKGVSYNLNNAGEVAFNFSGLNNDFTKGGVLVNLVFERRNASVGTTNVYLNVTDLTSKATTYVEDGVIATTEGITVTPAIAGAEASEPATEEVATDAVTNIKVNVTSNLCDDAVSYDVKNSLVKVTFNLTAGEPVAYGEAVVTYDDAVLALEAKNNSAADMFPVVTDAEYNLNAGQGQMEFNFTNLDAANKKGVYDFSSGGALVTLVFTVKSGAQGNADINLAVENLGTLAREYVTDYEVSDDVKGAIVVATEQAPTNPTDPTDPTTKPTDPTQPTTKAPSLKLKSSSLKAGKTTTATVSNANGKKVTYKSSNTKVATINKTSGKITALAKGKVTITATVGTKKLTKKLTVTTDPQIKKGKKVVKKGTFTIKKGKKLTLTITGKASSVKNKIKYSKKNIVKTTTKLTQSKVTFKGNKKGTTKVTITINNVKKYTYTIKVK